jgi:ubiquinone/menaquinone biosynthesis C-methylase UbiE
LISFSDPWTFLRKLRWPLSPERALDVATGTGWTARRLSSRGAKVTGIDIGEGVIEAAKRIAPEIDFKVGDAEALEFPDQRLTA